MMALALIVVASMIGAKGLSEIVLLDLQRGHPGLGFVSGLAMMLLAFALLHDKCALIGRTRRVVILWKLTSLRFGEESWRSPIVRRIANHVTRSIKNAARGQMKQGLRIDANYTEDVVGFALESFLALLSFPRQRFSIEPFSRSKERWLGADARLHGRIRGFRPFYMQFKRPAAYPDFSASKIVTDRRKTGLATAPRSLYFPLRQKRATHRDFQHNVLFRLRERLLKRGLGDAAYVCPLFLDRSAYRLNLHWSGLSRWGRIWRRHPWEIEDVMLTDGGSQIRFDRMPVFAEHISVPPHAKVTTASHNYSFTESGIDLCFHSPEALPDGSMSFARFLEKVSSGFLVDGEKLAPDGSDQMLSELIAGIDGDQTTTGSMFRPEGEGPIGRWFSWGDHLRSEYEIEQFALVRWEDEGDVF